MSGQHVITSVPSFSSCSKGGWSVNVQLSYGTDVAAKTRVVYNCPQSRLKCALGPFGICCQLLNREGE
jgi:hypothetical protein